LPQRQAGGDDIIGVDAEINSHHAGSGLRHQTGASQEGERRSDLDRDQQRTRATRAWILRGTASGTGDGCRIPAATQRHKGQDSQDERHDRPADQRRGEHSSVNPQTGKAARDLAVHQPLNHGSDKGKDAARRNQTDDQRHDTERHAFEREEPRDAQVTRAESEPNRQFAFSPARSHNRQYGHVGAGNEQDQRRRCSH